MGGVFNGQIVQVSGMRIPEMAEQGIYFVESMSRDLINPPHRLVTGSFHYP